VSDGTSSGTFLLQDIVVKTDPFEETDSSQSTNFFKLNSSVYFASSLYPFNYCGINAFWRTDGTTEGTQIVKQDPECREFNPFSPAPLLSLELNKMLLAAGDSVHGRELWVTNGTTDGTQFIFDIDTEINWDGATFSSNPSGAILFKNDIYLFAETYAEGCEVRKVNRSLNTVTLLKDIYPGRNNEDLPNNGATGGGFLEFENALYFGATDALGGGLWKTNGKTAGTVLVKRICLSGPNDCSAISGKPFKLRNNIFFSANDGVNGEELWISDGTEAGTYLFMDLNPFGSSSPNLLMTYKGNLFFTATTPTEGNELWKTDGTVQGTVLFKDINPGLASSSPGPFIEAKGKLYFAAETANYGRELWSTDGTNSRTVMVYDIAEGTSDSNPSTFALAGDTLFFSASDKVELNNNHGHELWALDLE